MARPLNIVIVGAGIGGLTAGLALRQNGHHVTIIESSKFSNETGAAIHIAPNANGLLRRLGVFVEDFGANECRGIRVYTPGGHQVLNQDLSNDNKKWEHPWHLVHRGHLHLALWAKATGKGGKGQPCELRLAHRAKFVDPHRAEVTLENGDVISGDLVLGADGVHSRCRKALELDHCPEPFDGGDSAFRFLVPVAELLECKDTRDIIGPPGTLHMVIDKDRRLVYYPCVNDSLMNCLLIHPSELSRGDNQDWNQQGDKARLLKIGQSFAPGFGAIMSKAPEDSLKVWTLLDLEVLPRWVNGKLALLGDAAHPFLPHQAQGGAQAIEDAISLAAVLPLGTEVDDVNERLVLYQQCRKERADHIQAYTRLSGKSFEEQKKAGVKYEAMEFTKFNFSHDEWHHSTAKLEKLIWSKRPYRWRQPLSFGPSPGPRQSLNQLPDISTHPEQYQIVHTMRFTTSGTYIRKLFPTPSFSFNLPNTLVQASIVCCSLKNLTWLGGSGYDHCGLYIHGVQYKKQNGELLHGTFLPILFENLADPIITGREEIAAPKLSCDIDIESPESGNARTVRLSWRGTTFGELKFGDLLEESQDPAEKGRSDQGKAVTPMPTPDDGIFMYRYVPAVGEPGKADAEYAVFDPFPERQSGANGAEENDIGKRSDNQVECAKRVARSPKLGFHAGDWSSLPTIHHITAVLAEIPIYEILEATVERKDSVGDRRGVRRIE